MIKQFKLIDDLSNADYHKQRSAKEHHYSSSQLKKILESPEAFHEAYLSDGAKAKVADSLQQVFHIGTYFHTAILEPHLLEKECAVYTEGARRGVKWDKFKEANEGKAIITKTEYGKAMNLVKGVQKNPLSCSIYTEGKAETSLFVQYLVNDTGVYLKADSGKIFRLVAGGWASMTSNFKLGECTAIKVKVRCDYRHQDLGYIADLKSTTGDPRDADEIAKKIAQYEYDFSAVLYMDAFNAELLYRGETAKYHDFIWTFATKDGVQSKNWFMNSVQQQIGRAKVVKALQSLAKNIEDDWQFTPEADFISSMPVPRWEYQKWIGSSDMPQIEVSNALTEALLERVLLAEEEACEEIGDDELDGL